MGLIVFRVSARRRNIAIKNIEMVKEAGALPAELDAQATARESFSNMGRAGWEALRLYHYGLNAGEQKQFFFSGQENMKEALKATNSKCGLFMVTGHIGNWELLVQQISVECNFKINIVGRQTGNSLVDTFIHRLRTKHGNNFIDRKDGARRILASLKRGENLGTLIDQADLNATPLVYIPFLGRDTVTNLAPIRLAFATSSPILMTLFWREGQNNYYKAMPPIFTADLPRTEESFLKVATQLNEMLSKHIQEFPDQWMWGHRRWKTPGGLKKDPKSIT